MRKVRILGEIYRVVRKLPKQFKELDASEFYGLCFREEKIIWVNPKCEGRDFYRTLIHEMGHALQESNGIVYTGVLDPAVEEILVESNAKMVDCLIHDMLKDFLREKDDKLLRSKLEGYCKS